MCFTAVSKIPRACRVESPTFETINLSCSAAACTMRRAMAQAGAWECRLHAAFFWPRGAISPRGCVMQKALRWCWPPRRPGRRWSWNTWEVLGPLSSTSGAAAPGGRVMLMGLLAPEAAKWNVFFCLPKMEGLWGLFSQLIVLFSWLHFPPPPLRQEVPHQWLAWGLLTRAQLLSSKDVAFRNSWVS